MIQVFTKTSGKIDNKNITKLGINYSFFIKGKCYYLSQRELNIF